VLDTGIKIFTRYTTLLDTIHRPHRINLLDIRMQAKFRNSALLDAGVQVLIRYCT
jgi:hypothetical protein